MRSRLWLPHAPKEGIPRKWSEVKELRTRNPTPYMSGSIAAAQKRRAEQQPPQK